MAASEGRKNSQGCEDDKAPSWVVANPGEEAGLDAADVWKVPIWQRPINPASLALHPDGPLNDQKRDGYLQKRAGSSRLRWNIRYFELSDGFLKWWRPQFTDQLRMPVRPKVALKEPRPRPVRSLDLSKLSRVVRTRVKFPYSTRILLCFREDYTKYRLELRAERENIILEWYRLFDRFAVESFEEVVERVEDEKEDTIATPGSQSDGEEEEGFEDVPSVGDDREDPKPCSGADASIPEERRAPLAKAKLAPPTSSSAAGGYPTSAPAPDTSAAASSGYTAV